MLRPFQTQAIERLSAPGHLLCIAPTGSGKSLIYETLARQQGRRTLLVTPLRALARQQEERFKAAGLPVSAGKIPPPGHGAWILSPERLCSPLAREWLQAWRPDFWVIDECHCVWEWGRGFRPCFRAIQPLLKRCPPARSLWLTATLPPEARDALRAGLPGTLAEMGEFELPERLRLQVERVPWLERAPRLRARIAALNGPGIIFVNTRESTSRVGRALEGTGRRAAAYHAGLSREEKRAIEDGLRRQEIDTLVATSAFGMGMDLPELRWVILWQAPYSLLALAQAIGRAARTRDRDSSALVFWSPEDLRLVESEATSALHRFFSATGCRRAALKEYFDGKMAHLEPCGRCDRCNSTNLEYFSPAALPP